jgi:hypothetical protein
LHAATGNSEAHRQMRLSTSALPHRCRTLLAVFAGRRLSGAALAPHSDACPFGPLRAPPPQAARLACFSLFRSHSLCLCSVFFRFIQQCGSVRLACHLLYRCYCYVALFLIRQLWLSALSLCLFAGACACRAALRASDRACRTLCERICLFVSQSVSDCCSALPFVPHSLTHSLTHSLAPLSR